MWRDDCTLHGMPGKRPPRLLAFNYTGCHAYFLTICTLERRTVFDDQNHAESALDQLLRAAADYQFEIIAYCLMPNHLHALVRGLVDDADFRRFVSMYKQRSSFRYRKSANAGLWQEGYFDNVRREDEDVTGVAAYIVANPVRAALCRKSSRVCLSWFARLLAREFD